MTILLIFATNSGTTQMVAHEIGNALGAAGHTVKILEVRETKPEDLDSADAIVLGSPSWDFDGKEGQPHEDFPSFMDAMKGKTIAKPFAIFGLGDSSYKYFCGAVGQLEEFAKSLGGTVVVPSLKIDKYYSDMEGNTKKINDWVQDLKKKLSA